MKLVSNHFKYASNVWLTSATLTPCLIGFLAAIFDGGINALPAIILLMIPFGIVFSIPNYIILLFLVWQINTTKLAVTEKKIIINFIAVILTFALFMIISYSPNRIDTEGVQLALVYSLTLTFGVWVFNLYRQVHEGFLKKEPIPKIKTLEDILDDDVY